MKSKPHESQTSPEVELHPIQFFVGKKVWIAAKKFVLDSEDKTIQSLMTKLLTNHLKEKTGEKLE